MAAVGVSHEVATDLPALAPYLCMPSLANVSKAEALETVLSSPQREFPCLAHRTGAPIGLLDPSDLSPSLGWSEYQPTGRRLQLHYPTATPGAAKSLT